MALTVPMLPRVDPVATFHKPLGVQISDFDQLLTIERIGKNSQGHHFDCFPEGQHVLCIRQQYLDFVALQATFALSDCQNSQDSFGRASCFILWFFKFTACRNGTTLRGMSVGRIIEGPACVAEGAAYLASIDPRFATALKQTGPLPLRLRPDGFAALLSAIVSQQVSVASASAIWARLTAAGLTGPRKIKWASDEDLRACGLSRQKIRYARELANANIRFGKLRTMPTEDVVETLIAVPGVGRWTAEIYTMFSLGRADVFAPADLALQESARIVFEMPQRPTEKELRVLAEDWAPWRAVAARLLFAYYHVAKEREGIR